MTEFEVTATAMCEAHRDGMLVCVALSKNQLDKLGDRLRKAAVPAAEDVALYDEYRALHGEALDHVGRRIWEETGLMPGGRVKSIESTTAKLRRQRIR